MSRQHLGLHVQVILLVIGMARAVPIFAGSEVVGSLIGSTDVTVDGLPALPSQTIFSGDRLQVSNGVAAVIMEGGGGIVLGHNTVASFVRDSNATTATLSEGRARIYCGYGYGPQLHLKSGAITISPALASKTLGEVVIRDQTLSVMTKEGSLRLEGSGERLDVPEGRAIRLTLESGQYSLYGSERAPSRFNLKRPLPLPIVEGAPMTAAHGQWRPGTRQAHADAAKVGKGICKHDPDEVSPSHPKKDKDEGCPNDDEEDE